MESEFKLGIALAALFIVTLFGTLLASEYLTHQRDLACIERGGTPANSTCLYGVKP